MIGSAVVSLAIVFPYELPVSLLDNGALEGDLSTHSAVRITPVRLAELTAAEWVDVCGALAKG